MNLDNPQDVRDLLGFMSPSSRKDVLLVSLKLVHDVTGTPGVIAAWIRLNFQELLGRLETLLVPSQPIREVEMLGWQSLTNLSTHDDPAIIDPVCASAGLIGRALDVLVEGNEFSVYVGKLLSNCTRSEKHARAVYSMPRIHKHLNSVMDIFSKNDSSPGFDPVISDISGFFLRNLSQLEEFRRDYIFANKSLGVKKYTGESENISAEQNIRKQDYPKFEKFLSLMEHPSVLRRQVAVDVVKNCCFQTDLHQKMITVPDFIVHLLRPLTGPEEFDDEDNEQLPIDLQFMDPTKQRESVPAIRISLLEALYQLCAMSTGRIYLRQNGSYLILRELHKWESNEEAELLCGNVVGVLIRTEEEIGEENLREMQEEENLIEGKAVTSSDVIKMIE